MDARHGVKSDKDVLAELVDAEPAADATPEADEDLAFEVLASRCPKTVI